MKDAFRKTVEEWTAEELLAIPESNPEQLLTPDLKDFDADVIKKYFKHLALQWSPNNKKRAIPEIVLTEVFKHVTNLRDQAEKLLADETWQTPGVFKIKQKNGKPATIRYFKKYDFELGQFFICDSNLVYVINEEFKDLFDNGISAIENLKFDNDKMRDYFKPQLPEIKGQFTAEDGRKVVVFKRDNHMILLRDFLDYMKGKVPVKHTAWIMSRLNNMVSYLEWAGLVHNDLSLDTVFILPKDGNFKATADEKISPKDHTMGLFGGWWYARAKGEKLLGLPPNTTNYAGTALLRSGKADKGVDHTLIRVIGRQLLGDESGVSLPHDKAVPKLVAEWLTTPGSGKAKADYAQWSKVLKESFGARRYTELDIKPGDIYQPT